MDNVDDNDTKLGTPTTYSMTNKLRWPGHVVYGNLFPPCTRLLFCPGLTRRVAVVSNHYDILTYATGRSNTDLALDMTNTVGSEKPKLESKSFDIFQAPSSGRLK